LGENWGRIYPLLVVAIRTAPRRSSSVYLFAIFKRLHSKDCSKETALNRGKPMSHEIETIPPLAVLRKWSFNVRFFCNGDIVAVSFTGSKSAFTVMVRSLICMILSKGLALKGSAQIRLTPRRTGLLRAMLSNSEF